MFDYLNIRVYDDEKTDLLKHWDNTFKYINKAKTEGSKVLVHCKMGISRSASVVIAYAMKAFNWNFDKALKHVKAKRSCIKPNTNFLNQLETYQGILDAMKNKEKLQRSKSETNLKAPKSASKTENKMTDPTPLVLALTGSYPGRPRSWSPDTKLASELLPPTSVSLEHLACPETRHMLMPCAHGSYSVSPNQIIRLKGQGAPSVRHIVHEIETASQPREPPRRSQRLNFGADAGPDAAKGSPQTNSGQKYSETDSEADKIHTWDPGEPWRDEIPNVIDSDDIVKSDSGIVDVKVKASDAIYSSFSRAEEAGSWSSLDSAVGGDACAWGGRLSASAPADSWLRAGPRRRRLAAASHGDLPRAAPGLVRNLKKEFEARSAPPAPPPADASKKCKLAAAGAERPPPAPFPLDYTNVVSTVMSKAQNKKQLQHGKTHPLTRLNLNRSNNRCSNPVYNTM